VSERKKENVAGECRAAIATFNHEIKIKDVNHIMEDEN
jgi:hypothetical protein